MQNLFQSLFYLWEKSVVINCEDCGKRHCLYSDKSLSHEEQEDYQQALDSYSYSCGAPIFPDEHYLKEICYYCGEYDSSTIFERAF